jgi:hypothetical protein
MAVMARMGKGWVRMERDRPLKYRWDLADWGRTDKEVAKALGVSNHNVVSQYRFRHGIWKKGAKANVGKLGHPVTVMGKNTSTVS